MHCFYDKLNDDNDDDDDVTMTCAYSVPVARGGDADDDDGVTMT